MSAPSDRCARCGEELPDGVSVCPSCGAAVGDAPRPAAAPPPGAEVDRPSGEIARRIEKLRQWSDAAQALGVAIPQLPSWAEESVKAGGDPDGWNEILRGVERLAQQRLIAALELWERETRNRLTRLEAYAVDGRLEREQIEDVIHAARGGEVAPALSAFQQVDRVLTLKERHLDQARDELERLVSLLRDMQALGLTEGQDPADLTEELERELRGGRLALLKQRLRNLRAQALTNLEAGLRGYVRQYGDFLVQERTAGANVDLEAAELARGAREYARGKPEEALRRLRILSQVHGAGPTRPTRAPPTDGGRADATGASRTA